MAGSYPKAGRCVVDVKPAFGTRLGHGPRPRMESERGLAVVLLVVTFGLALGGCISQAEMLAKHRQACLTYGFAPGSEGYANCLLQLDIGDYGYSHHGRPSSGMPHPATRVIAPTDPAPR